MMESHIRFEYLLFLGAVFMNLIVTQQQEIPENDPCDGVELGDFVRGPINCSHYVFCDDEAPYDDFCEDGKYFDVEIQGCDDPDNVQCDSGENYEEYYEDNEEEEAEEYEYEEEEEDATEKSIPAAKNCPKSDNPRNVVFISSTESCSEYFLCYHGSLISMHCADNLHFNPETNKCDFPRKSDCKIGDAKTPTTHPKCDRDTIEFYPHPTNCDFYYYCRKGYLSIQQCPFYYYFEASSKTCQIRDGTQCIKR